MTHSKNWPLKYRELRVNNERVGRQCEHSGFFLGLHSLWGPNTFSIEIKTWRYTVKMCTGVSKHLPIPTHASAISHHAHWSFGGNQALKLQWINGKLGELLELEWGQWGGRVAKSLIGIEEKTPDLTRFMGSGAEIPEVDPFFRLSCCILLGIAQSCHFLAPCVMFQPCLNRFSNSKTTAKTTPVTESFQGRCIIGLNWCVEETQLRSSFFCSLITHRPWNSDHALFDFLRISISVYLCSSSWKFSDFAKHLP